MQISAKLAKAQTPAELLQRDPLVRDSVGVSLSGTIPRPDLTHITARDDFSSLSTTYIHFLIGQQELLRVPDDQSRGQERNPDAGCDSGDGRAGSITLSCFFLHDIICACMYA